MKTFIVFDKVLAQFVNDTCGCCLAKFDTREEAEEYVKEELPSGVHAIEGYFEIQEYSTTAWVRRERYRLQDGTYYPVVWDKEPWYLARKEVLRVFDHVHPDDPELIGYTPTARKGRDDIQEYIKPGKFLKKFFGDVLDQKQIHYWSDRHKERYAVDQKLQWASTPDEIEHVYSMDCGFESCMQGSADDNGWMIHPVRAYGAGDLKVAYLTQGDLLIARALVWPEQNRVGRVYGDGALLRKALADAGIETNSTIHKYDSFLGARLLEIILQEDYTEEDIRRNITRAALPYLDGAYSGLNPHPTEPGVLVIVDEEYDCDADEYGEPALYSSQHAEGYSEKSKNCACCSRYTRSNRTSYVNTKVDGQEVLQAYCERCQRTAERSGKIFQCHSSYEYYDIEHYTKVRMNYMSYWDEQNVSITVAESANGFYCAKTGEYWRNDYMVMYNGETWSKKALDQYTFISTLSGKRYLKDEMAWIPRLGYVANTEILHSNNDHLFGLDLAA